MNFIFTRVTLLLLFFTVSFTQINAQWTSVGNSTGITSGQATENELAFGKNDTPMVGCIEIVSGRWNASVLKFDGSAWQYVGAAGIAASRVNAV
ncbi:MAG: hypothetical protein ACXWDO_05675, partial [Bacteroidia bacterium]